MKTQLIAYLFAQASEVATPVNILFGAVTSLTAALIALYKDCRNDRAMLWKHVQNLEEKLGVTPPPRPPGRH